MADKKITQLTNITGANLVDADEFVVVDISADETKAITLGELKEAFDSGSGFVRITGDTMTGDLALSGADVTFGDNDKAIFGAGSDLQIYHDGTNNRLTFNSTNTYLQTDGITHFTNIGNTEKHLTINDDGAVDLYHNNNLKLATTSTGVDITGTAVTDGLTVNAGTGALQTNITGAGSLFRLQNYSGNGSTINSDLYKIALTYDSANYNAGLHFTRGSGATDGHFYISTNNQTKRLEVDNYGDLSLYDSTGTTPKFFWDASAESLGIGTTSPSEILTLDDTDPKLAFRDAGVERAFLQVDTSNNFVINNKSLSNLIFETGDTERMRISSSGKVLVGFDNAAYANGDLVVGKGTSSGNSTLGIQSNGSTNLNKINFGDGSRGDRASIISGSTNYLAFSTFDGSSTTQERMRIDSSGNVGIGTTSLSSATFSNYLQIEAIYPGVVYNSTAGGTNYKYSTGVDDNVWIVRDETAGATRMLIDSSGNVGIGTSSISNAKLKVSSSGAGGAIMSEDTDNTTSFVRILGDAASQNLVNWQDGTSLRFATSTQAYGSFTERLRIDSSGNLLVGKTSSSGVKMDVLVTASDNLVARFENSHATGSYGISVKAGDDSGNYAADFANKSGTSLMRIRGDGNVGIGTSSPSAALTVQTSAGSLSVDALGGGAAQITSPTSLGFNAASAYNHHFYIAGSEVMRIDSSGNLLVGTTLTSEVDESGTRIVAGDAGFIQHSRTSTTDTLPNVVLARGNDGEAIRFIRNDGSNREVGDIVLNTSSTSYNTSSDHRLKENVVELTGATTRLKQLEPKRFNFIADADTTVDGFLAHEVQAVVPEAIHGTHNEVDADGNPVYQGIDQSKLVPLLVATIQELEARITALENA